MIRRVGPGHAKRLVRAFSSELFEGIELYPEQLRDVSGIVQLRAKHIVRTCADQKVIREMMVFRSGHGVARRVRCRSSTPTPTRPCGGTALVTKAKDRWVIFFTDQHRCSPGVAERLAAITAAPASRPAIDPANAIPWGKQRTGMMLAGS